MNKRLLAHPGFLYFFLIVASIALSCWISLRESVINPDAICYLLSAEMIGKSGMHVAMHLCGQAKWPFYSTLIYFFVKLTHVSYVTAAYILNGFFTLISVTTFVLIIKALGGSQRLLWMAAAVILLAHEFNSVRQYIVRDHGFWAFYLISLLLLLQYFRQPSWMKALAWSISLVVATLFRIEGAIFLLLLPFLAWFSVEDNWRKRFNYFFALNLLTLFIVVAIFAWLVLHPTQSLAQFGRVHEVADQFLHGFSSVVIRYQAIKSALIQYVLTSEAARDAGLVIFILLIVWYLLNIASNLSWIYALLVIYAWRDKVVSFTRKNN